METLSKPEDLNWQWGVLVTIEWIKQLAADGSFDPSAERFVAIAEIIDEIYQ